MAGTCISPSEFISQDANGSRRMVDGHPNTKDAADGHSESSEPVRKKRKTETAEAQVSSSHQFMEFSDDVILRIMSHLLPADLAAISQ